MNLEFHALATLFPLLDTPGFDELVADIRAHGLREPIVMFEGKVLDGRNRYRACIEFRRGANIHGLPGRRPRRLTSFRSISAAAISMNRNAPWWPPNWRRSNSETISTARVCQLAEARNCSKSANARLPVLAKSKNMAPSSLCMQLSRASFLSRRPPTLRVCQLTNSVRL